MEFDSIRGLQSDSLSGKKVAVECMVRFGDSKDDQNSESISRTYPVETRFESNQQLSNFIIRQPYCFRVDFEARFLIVEVFCTEISESGGYRRDESIKKGHILINLDQIGSIRDQNMQSEGLLNEFGIHSAQGGRFFFRLYKIDNTTSNQFKLSAHNNLNLTQALNDIKVHLPAGKLLPIPSLASDDECQRLGLRSASAVRAGSIAGIEFKSIDYLRLNAAEFQQLSQSRQSDQMHDSLYSLGCASVNNIVLNLGDLRLRAHESVFNDVRRSLVKHQAVIESSHEDINSVAPISPSIFLHIGIHNGSRFVLHPRDLKVPLITTKNPKPVPPGPGDFEGSEPALPTQKGVGVVEFQASNPEAEISDFKFPWTAQSAIVFEVHADTSFVKSMKTVQPCIAWGIVLPQKHVWPITNSNAAVSLNNLNSSSFPNSQPSGLREDNSGLKTADLIAQQQFLSDNHGNSGHLIQSQQQPTMSSWFSLFFISDDDGDGVCLTDEKVFSSGKNPFFDLHLSIKSPEMAKLVKTRSIGNNNASSAAAKILGLNTNSTPIINVNPPSTQQPDVNNTSSANLTKSTKMSLATAALPSPLESPPLVHNPPLPPEQIESQVAQFNAIYSSLEEKLAKLPPPMADGMPAPPKALLRPQLDLAAELVDPLRKILQSQREAMMHYRLSPSPPLSTHGSFVEIPHKRAAEGLKIFDFLVSTNDRLPDLSIQKTSIEQLKTFAKNFQIPSLPQQVTSSNPSVIPTPYKNSNSSTNQLLSHAVPNHSNNNYSNSNSINVARGVNSQNVMFTPNITASMIPNPDVLASLSNEQKRSLARLRQREAFELQTASSIAESLRVLSLDLASSATQDPSSSASIGRRYKALVQQREEGKVRMNRLQSLIEELENSRLAPIPLQQLEDENSDLFHVPNDPGNSTANHRYNSNADNFKSTSQIYSPSRSLPHPAGASLFPANYRGTSPIRQATARELPPPQWGAAHPDHPVSQRLGLLDRSGSPMRRGGSPSPPRGGGMDTMNNDIPLFLQRSRMGEAQVSTLIAAAPDAFGAVFNTAADPLGRRKPPVSFAAPDSSQHRMGDGPGYAPAAGFVPSGLPIDWMVETLDPFQADEVSFHFLQFAPRSRALLGAANRSLRKGSTATTLNSAGENALSLSNAAFEFSTNVRMAMRFFMFPPACTASANVKFSPFSSSGNNPMLLRSEETGEPLSLSFLVGPQTSSPFLARYQTLDMQEPHPFRHHHDLNMYDPRMHSTSFIGDGITPACVGKPYRSTTSVHSHHFHTAGSIHGMSTFSGGFNNSVFGNSKPIHADAAYTSIADAFATTGVAVGAFPGSLKPTNRDGSSSLEQRLHPTHLELVRYMFGRCVEVEVWAANDAVHLGSAFIPLTGLIRQQRQVAKEVFSYPVLDTLTGELVGEITILATCVGHKAKHSLPRLADGSTSAIDTRKLGSVDANAYFAQPAPASFREGIARVKAVRLSDSGAMGTLDYTRAMNTTKTVVNVIDPNTQRITTVNGGFMATHLESSDSDVARRIARFHQVKAGCTQGSQLYMGLIGNRTGNSLFNTSHAFKSALMDQGRAHTVGEVSGNYIDVVDESNKHLFTEKNKSGIPYFDSGLGVAGIEETLPNQRSLETLSKAATIRASQMDSLVKDVLTEFRRETLTIEPNQGVAFFFVLEFHNPYAQETAFVINISYSDRRRPPNDVTGRYSYMLTGGNNGNNTQHGSATGNANASNFTPFVEDDIVDEMALPIVVPLSERIFGVGSSNLPGGAFFNTANKGDGLEPEPLLQPELTICSDALEWYAGVRRQSAIVQNSFLDSISADVRQGEVLTGMAGLHTVGTHGAFHNSRTEPSSNIASSKIQEDQFRSATLAQLANFAGTHTRTGDCHRCTDRAHTNVFGHPVPSFDLASPCPSTANMEDPYQPREDGTAQKFIVVLKPHEQVFIPMKFFSVTMLPAEESIGVNYTASLVPAHSTTFARQDQTGNPAHEVETVANMTGGYGAPWKSRPECLALETPKMSLSSTLRAWQRRVALFSKNITVLFRRAGPGGDANFDNSHIDSLDSSVLREVCVKIIPRPMIIDSILRLYTEEGSTLTREASICIPIPTEPAALKDPNVTAALTNSHFATATMTARAGASYVICTDSSVVLSGFETPISNPTAGGDPSSAQQWVKVRIRMAVHMGIGSRGKPRRFLLLFFNKSAPSILSAAIAIQVSALRRETCSLTVGTSSIKHISIPPYLSGRSLRLVSTDESLCELLPANHAEGSSTGEFRVKVTPYAAGTQLCRLQAIDQNTGELAAAWALQVDGKVPEVAQGHFLYVPPSRISKRSVAFRNPLNYDSIFHVRTSAPILVQPITASIRVRAGADQSVELAICSDLSTLALFGSSEEVNVGLHSGSFGGNPVFQSLLAGHRGASESMMTVGGQLSKFDSTYAGNQMDESVMLGLNGGYGPKSLITVDAFMFISSEHGEVADVHLLKIFVTRQA